MINLTESFSVAVPAKWRRGSRGQVIGSRDRRRLAWIACAMTLTLAAPPVPGQQQQQQQPTGELGSVRLLLEDSIGVTSVQQAQLYAASSAELKDPVAESSGPDKVIKVRAGKYWLVPVDDQSLSETVTVVAGETQDVKLSVDRSLWLTFTEKKDALPGKVLMKVRAKPKLEDWLKGMRLGADYYLAQRRPNATDADLEAARQLALKRLAEFLNEPAKAPESATPQEKEAWGAERSFEGSLLFKILSVAGRMEDVETLANLWRPGYPEGWFESLITAIGVIEARHDSLEKGRLASMLTAELPAQSVTAARTLRFLGLPVGTDVLRRYLISRADATEGYSPAYWLVDDPSPDTIRAMREFLAQRLKDNKSMFVEGCIYLLAHGNKEDWQFVASLTFPTWELSQLAFAAEDPRPLIRNASAALQQMRDRDPAEFEELIQWVRTHVSQRAVGSKTGLDARTAYNTSLNTLVMRQSNLIPDALAVRFYKGFAGVTPLGKGLAEPGSLVSQLTWLPYPEQLDVFVKEWLEYKMRYNWQLEFADLGAIEDAVKRLGNGKRPPGYDLYRAYHRIAHRQRSAGDPLPMGERRRPYLFAFRERSSSGEEEYGGGISGVASLRAEWQGKSLAVEIKLDQRAHYESSGAFLNIGGRQDVSEYPHHRYMAENGRPLIDSVVVRRGAKPLVVSEQKADDGWGGGWFRFAVTLDEPSLSELWVDVNLKCIDQTITLTDGLFAGPVGASLREARYNARAGKGEPTTPAAQQ